MFSSVCVDNLYTEVHMCTGVSVCVMYVCIFICTDSLYIRVCAVDMHLYICVMCLPVCPHVDELCKTVKRVAASVASGRISVLPVNP